MEENSINHPSHYTAGPIYRRPECIDLTRLLPFCAGNAIKYIWRAGHKGDWREDLAKAKWYWNDSGFSVPSDAQNRALDMIALFDKDNASIEWQLKIRLFEMIVAGIMSKDTREEALAALERYFEENRKIWEYGRLQMNEFEKLVKEMRSMQKAYFRTLDAATLQACKRLEKEVDKYLADKESQQMELFGGVKNENVQ